MKHLHIDIETYCELDLSKVGVYRYAEDDSFRIILFAYSFDDEPVTVIDCSCEGIPPSVHRALVDPGVQKIAHNANFEIVCISTYYGIELNPEQWYCTMVGAAYLGLPMRLDKVGSVLGLPEQKDARGKSLITYFCKPCKPTKRNGGRTRNLPEHDPKKWSAFKAYNEQDVRTEKAVFAYISRFPAPPASEHRYWVMDQIINAKGIAIDREFIEAATDANRRFIGGVHAEIKRLTGVENPNSLPQLKAWFFQETGYHAPSLGKDYLRDALEGGMLPERVERVLRLRGLASKTSVSKYNAMLAYAGKDGRIRGLLQFYGAGRTGRFSGRGVQVQNLKRTMKRGPLTAREAVLKGVADMLYDDVPEVISGLTRTALTAPDGYCLAVSDFSAIEARVIAWIAGEEWVLDVFRTHGKIYEATASNMFGVPLDMIGKGSDLRAKGKVATLALGYQGGAGALIALGALREGLDEAELPALVRAWRAANPRIVRLWQETEQAAKYAITRKTTCILQKPYCRIVFSYDRGYLFIELPSGRRLAYYGASVDNGRLSFWGMDQTKKAWCRQDTYGGSLVENITQAVARDCLCDAMWRIHKAGHPVLMHVHDEIICEATDINATDVLEEMNRIMADPPKWAGELPLKGDGYVSKYYKKD